MGVYEHTIFALTSWSFNGSDLSISWVDMGGSDYDIYRQNTAYADELTPFVSDDDGNSYVDTGMTEQVPYFYVVTKADQPETRTTELGVFHFQLDVGD